MKRGWNVVPLLLFWGPALGSALLNASCLGSNGPGEDLASQLARYPDKGRKAIDPVITPGFLSLTFDDGPSPYTGHIVDVMARHGIQATFFWVGRLMAGHRDMLDYARDRGQQIASHSFNHEAQPSLSEEVFKHRVRAVKLNIGDADNGRLYFRFPFGAAGDDQLRWLSELDFDGKRYRPVGWHIDSQDFDFDAEYPTAPHSERIEDDEDLAGECDGQHNPFKHDFVGWTQYTARKNKGGVMLLHDTKRITNDKIEEIVTAFEAPDRYWASLPLDKQEEYGRYYSCQKADRLFRFEFQSLWSGAWPSLRD